MIRPARRAAEAMGDETAGKAVERLFGRYGDEIYRFARFSLGSSPEAQDVVQEVFLGALRNWDRFAGRSSERTWLFAIAKHAIADSLRRRRSDPSESTERLQSVQAAEDVGLGRLDLEASLRLLPIAQRQVFILRIIEDRSVAETSTLLGRSAVWVRVTLHRALRRLRESLSSERAPHEGEGTTT